MAWDGEVLAAEIRREFAIAQSALRPWRLRIGDMLHDARFISDQNRFVNSPKYKNKAKREQKIATAAKRLRWAAAKAEEARIFEIAYAKRLADEQATIDAIRSRQ